MALFWDAGSFKKWHPMGGNRVTGIMPLKGFSGFCPLLPLFCFLCLRVLLCHVLFPWHMALPQTQNPHQLTVGPSLHNWVKTSFLLYKLSTSGICCSNSLTFLGVRKGANMVFVLWTSTHSCSPFPYSRGSQQEGALETSYALSDSSQQLPETGDSVWLEWISGGSSRRLQAGLGTLSVVKNYKVYIPKGYKKDGEFSTWRNSKCLRK